MKKTKYTRTKLKVIKFKKEDIIVTSGFKFTDALFGPGKGGVNVG